jgi:MFS family permease
VTELRGVPPPPAEQVGRRRLFADLTPLRASAPFRRLWISGLLSNIGIQMTAFAVALQVFLITHSSFAVGAVGLASALPAVAVGVVGGSLIDAFDRRRLVLLTSALLAVVSVVSTVQAYAEFGQLWLLYLLTGLQSALASVNVPARKTFIVRLLPAQQVSAGMVMTMLVVHTSFILGPAAAGLLAAAGGLKLCYLAAAIGFLVAIYGVARRAAWQRPATGSGNRRSCRGGFSCHPSSRNLAWDSSRARARARRSGRVAISWPSLTWRN